MQIPDTHLPDSKDNSIGMERRFAELLSQVDRLAKQSEIGKFQ